VLQRGRRSMTAVTVWFAQMHAPEPHASTGPPLDDGGDLATPPARVRG